MLGGFRVRGFAMLTLWGLLIVPVIAPAQTVFKLATVAPDSTSWMRVMREGTDEIEKRTEGRVKFKIYPGGVMGNDQAVLRKIRAGQLHAGAVTSGSLAEIFPDVQLYSLPLQFRNIDEINYVRRHMDKLIHEGLEQRGYVSLGIANGGFAYFAGSKPAGGVAELRRHKVWVPQGDVIGASVYKTAEISPVSLPISDVYTALQTGLLDTVISNPASMIAFQWHTRIKYLTHAPITFIIGMIVIDKKAFSKVNESDQKIIREIMMEKFRMLDDDNQRDNDKALEALRANGIEFIEPSESEKAVWVDIAERTLQDLSDKGAYSKDYLSAMRKHLEVFRGRQAGLND